MPNTLPLVVIAAIAGAGLVSGLLFAFSNVVIRAFNELSPREAMQVMQRINVMIINPLFLAAFMGTTALCAAIGILAAISVPSPAGPWLLTGALAYILGVFGVTVGFNIPLNNRLASASPSQADVVWPDYADHWLKWNHLRSLLGVVAVAALSAGLYSLAGGG